MVQAPARPALTPEQINSYQADGYVVVPDVFSREELEAIDREIDRLIPEAEDNLPHRAGWILQLGLRSDVTRRFAEDDRLADLVSPLVHPGVAIHSAKLVGKPPRTEEVCHWHQDDAFYIRPDDPGSYSATRMSAWVPLQDADERNGCVWIVPGSHKWGLQDYHAVDNGTCRKVIDREAYANQHAIPMRMRAGNVMLFSALLWHHSKGNQTDHVRRAFIVSYQEATLTQGAGDQWKVLRGPTA